MAKGTSSPSLFRYLDYRKFLRDWYQEAKRSRASTSFRTFSKRAGFKSTNFFKLVMDGERNLTDKSLTKFVVGLRLNKQEREFFRHLVGFNQAESHQERDQHYQQILQSRKFSQLKPIEKQQYEYYSTWYHPVIRELVVARGFDGTPEWIANQLAPSITPAQVEKSIELLEKLDLIEPAGPRKWRQISSVISTGPEVSSLIVLNYHKKLLSLTQEILEQVPPNERDVSTMTLGVLRERVPELKRKVQEFRRDILKLVSVDTTPEVVLQLNLQLIPLTRTSDGKETVK